MQSKSIRVCVCVRERKFADTRFFFLQRLRRTGNKSGIGRRMKTGKKSRRESGSMCGGCMIIATGGEGGQEGRLQ